MNHPYDHIPTLIASSPDHDLIKALFEYLGHLYRGEAPSYNTQDGKGIYAPCLQMHSDEPLPHHWKILICREADAFISGWYAMKKVKSADIPR